MDDFLENVEKYRDQLYRFALRNVWDSSFVDDVLASAVASAYENRHKFAPGTNFRAWLFKILINKCFVANRETMRVPFPLDQAPEDRLVDENAPGYRDMLEDPEEFLNQCGDEVYRAFRRISLVQRTCILLKDVEGFSYKEIAEMLEIPMATVMTHLARGRAHLRKELFEYARQRGIVRSGAAAVPRLEVIASRKAKEAG